MQINSKNEYLDRTIEFHRIYTEEICPIFRSYEVYRQKKSKELIWQYILAAVMFSCIIWGAPLIFAIAILFNITNKFILLLLILSILAIVCFSGVILKKAKDVEKGFLLTLKTDCLSRVLKVFGNVEWKNNSGIITDSMLNASGLFADFNIRNIDDEFQGSYKDVNFKICETEMLYESGSGKQRSVINVFKGVIILFDSNKVIKNRTIVSTKGDLTRKNSYWVYLLPLIYPLFQVLKDPKNILGWGIMLLLLLVYFYLYKEKMKKEENLDKVILEDPRFCKKYDVFSSDQVESRYLVTPRFMERFQNLRTVFGAEKAKCSFCGDKIMIAISTNKNLFEIGNMYKSLEDPESINAFYDELSSIYKMIAYFKLDQNTRL